MFKEEEVDVDIEDICSGLGSVSNEKSYSAIII